MRSKPLALPQLQAENQNFLTIGKRQFHHRYTQTFTKIYMALVFRSEITRETRKIHKTEKQIRTKIKHTIFTIP